MWQLWQLQLYCHVQPCAVPELARTRLHSLTLAHPPVGSHYLTLDRTRPQSPALAHTCQNSFALTHPPVGSHSLKLARTCLHSLALAHGH